MTTDQRAAPSLTRTLEAMRALRGRGSARAEGLDREARVTISLGVAKH